MLFQSSGAVFLHASGGHARWRGLCGHPGRPPSGGCLVDAVPKNPGLHQVSRLVFPEKCDKETSTL